MPDKIISYIEMCHREAASLQAGMNFGLGKTHSVILMSVRPNAPYQDRIEDGGTTLIYEGHDWPRTADHANPKDEDQPEFRDSGTRTQNGLFHEAAQRAKEGKRPPERVRVYEKLRKGIWAYNGVFHLVDSWREPDGTRWVFRFRLEAVEGEEDDLAVSTSVEPARRRIIPTSVKLEVWKRDGGKCVVCGATDELHFDHDVPYALGGSSIVAKNVQLMCARHNLQKSDRIT